MPNHLEQWKAKKRREFRDYCLTSPTTYLMDHEQKALWPFLDTYADELLALVRESVLKKPPHTCRDYGMCSTCVPYRLIEANFDRLQGDLKQP